MKLFPEVAEGRFAVMVAALLAAAVALALVLACPPNPLPATAPPTEFSAERAFRHVEAIAQTPRPAGSVASAAARAYVLEQLRKLDIPAEIVTGRSAEGHNASEIHNVLARLPGRANTKAFALTGHYDSVRYGPGAADDGAAVAALLETARALRTGPPLSNDVIFVFTDAEEGGLLGAKAFAQHPWAGEIGVLLGLESRGTSGGALMFETSSSNGWLIAELARANVGAFASSLASSIYERMPFNGDFSWLKRHGQQGFHVAFINDFAWYHTRNDRPENLGLASLQHHGNYALGLARHFGNLPLQNVTAPDAVYFNLLGTQLVHYPKSWSAPLAVAVGVSLGFTLLVGLVRKRLSLLGLLAGVAAWFGCALAASLGTLLLLAVVFGPGDLLAFHRSGMRDLHDLRALYHNDLYGLAFALAALGIFCAVLNLFLRKRCEEGRSPVPMAGGAEQFSLAPAEGERAGVRGQSATASDSNSSPTSQPTPSHGLGQSRRGSSLSPREERAGREPERGVLQRIQCLLSPALSSLLRREERESPPSSGSGGQSANSRSEISHPDPLPFRRGEGSDRGKASNSTAASVSRRIGMLNLTGGALIWWGLLLWLMQVGLPGGSYFATWPTLFGTVQLLILLAVPNEKSAAASTVAWLTLLALPAILLLVPAYRYMLSSVMIMSGPGLVLIVVLLGGLLIPQLELIARVRRWWLPSLAGGAALVLVGAGLATSSVTSRRPAFNCLAYGADLDAGKAFWMSSDAKPDEWTAQFFAPGTASADVTDFFPHYRLPALKAVAPLATLVGPDVRVSEDSIRNGRRRLALRLTSPDHAPVVKVVVVSDTEIFAASVFGQPVARARSGWDFSFNVFPSDGAELVLELPPQSPLILRVVEQHLHQPELPGVRPRPEYLICEPNTMHHNLSLGSDQMIVIRTFKFPPP